MVYGDTQNKIINKNLILANTENHLLKKAELIIKNSESEFFPFNKYENK